LEGSWAQVKTDRPLNQGTADDRPRRGRRLGLRRRVLSSDVEELAATVALHAVSPRTGQRLSRATVFSKLNALRAFFQWLSTQPGYRSHLTSADAEFFGLSDKEARIAQAITERPVPTIGPDPTVAAKHACRHRHRAAQPGRCGLHLLTGARDGAIASLKRKHVDVVDGKVVQDAREVRTKFSKTFTTWFFPVGEDIRQIVVDWVHYLDTLQLFGPTDPLFPATRIMQDQYHLFQDGRPLARALVQCHAHQGYLKDAFTSAGLPYANPHSFRKTVVTARRARMPEHRRSSRLESNLGHEQVSTTFTSYGQVGADRQAD